MGQVAQRATACDAAPIVPLIERQGSLRSRADEKAFFEWVKAQSHNDRMAMLSSSDAFKQAEKRWLAIASRLARARSEQMPRRNREVTTVAQARHAADVLQTMHMIVHQGGLTPHYADQHTVLSCYLAAVIHDFEHRGLSNDFVVNAGDKVAVSVACG